MTIITTKRLVLRPIEKSDASRFAVLCRDIDIARGTARIPHPYTCEDADLFVNHLIKGRLDENEFAFAVCLDGEIIACAGTMNTGDGTWEIGYWVGADYRGQGVASEAADAITQFSIRHLRASQVTAGYFFDNPASARVLENLGFRDTGETTMIFSRGRNAEVKSVRLSLAIDKFTGRPGVTIA